MDGLMQGITRKEGLILIAMSLAVLMDGLDASIVNVALPTIATTFGTDLSIAAWITIIYFMMIAGLMLPFGRIADSGHIKKVFLIGFLLFTVASLSCGLSVSFTMLCLSRVVQGLGAAMLGAVAPMICVKFIPAKNLGFSLGMLTLASSLGLAVGPALGGILTEYLSWHWVFFINVPIGLIAMVFGQKVLPADCETSKSHLDLKGTTLLFISIVAGVLALEWISMPDSSTVVTLSTAVFIIGMIGFIFVELRSECPLLNIRMFKNKKLDSVIISFLMINLAYFGLVYLLPFYLSIELDMDAATSGMVLLIPPAITLLMCIPVGRACDIHGRRPYAIAASAVQIVYSLMFLAIDPDMGVLALIPAAVCLGIVWGLCGASSSSRIVDAVPLEEKGMGSTLMNFVIYMSGTVGTALFASLMTMGAHSQGTAIGDLSPLAFMDGFTFSMYFALAMGVISVVTAWIVKEKKPGKTPE